MMERTISDSLSGRKAMRVAQPFVRRRLSSFDRYHLTQAIEANIPSFQDISSD
jgi:hypothetical protein